MRLNGGIIGPSQAQSINPSTAAGIYEPNNFYNLINLGNWFPPPQSFRLRYLIVAGGGGGGMDMGGGGGGGQVISGTVEVSLSLTNPNIPTHYSSQEFPLIVGKGGWGAPSGSLFAEDNTVPGNGGRWFRGDGAGPQYRLHQYTVRATNGFRSSFLGLTANGGGYGGSSYFGYTPDYGYGGGGSSGGGASGYSNQGGRQGAGTAGQGFDGGANGGYYYSGGGGGAGGAGAGGGNKPNGGIGLLNNITGTDLYWGGGGGGADYSADNPGNGGNGGGGGGASNSNTAGGIGGEGLNTGGWGFKGSNCAGGNGGANTGGGGGGGTHYWVKNFGGNGGSGVVILRIFNKNIKAIFSPGVTQLNSYALSDSNVHVVQETGDAPATVRFVTSFFGDLPEIFYGNYLIVGGGGGAGGANAGNSGSGGGGGGGIRQGNNILLYRNRPYRVTIGAGGPSQSANPGNRGSDSVFDTVRGTGGGGGAVNSSASGGGSGGGGWNNQEPPAPGNIQGCTLVEGFSGGRSSNDGPNYGGGGGGGGSWWGMFGTGTTGGSGGPGLFTTIAGKLCAFSGGGGAGAYNGGTAGLSGIGGGGWGKSNNTTGIDGQPNTGGGGGGTGGLVSGGVSVFGGAGGSGIIILTVPSDVTATFSGGVTFGLDQATITGTNVYYILATSTINETVTFS